jgi:hypothetical protein
MTAFREPVCRIPLALACAHALAACAFIAAFSAQAQPSYGDQGPTVYIQQGAPSQFSQAQLDQILAPVALYPDPLLSQMMMAATYPQEIEEAAQWSQANPGLSGESAVSAVADRDWDASVKSLVAFPQVLAWMRDNPEWMQALGQAFLAQQGDVLDSVQRLRQRAVATGTLQSSDRITVLQQGSSVLVQPAYPQVVYVPYFDPFVAYGPWGWSAYPPIRFYPGQAYAASPGYPGLFWGPGITLSSGFFFGSFDWQRRHARVHGRGRDGDRTGASVSESVNRAAGAANASAAAQGDWRHDPTRRRGDRQSASGVTGPQSRGAASSTAASPARRDEPAARPQPIVGATPSIASPVPPASRAAAQSPSPPAADAASRGRGPGEARREGPSRQEQSKQRGRDSDAPANRPQPIVGPAPGLGSPTPRSQPQSIIGGAGTAQSAPQAQPLHRQASGEHNRGSRGAIAQQAPAVTLGGPGPRMAEPRPTLAPRVQAPHVQAPHAPASNMTGAPRSDAPERARAGDRPQAAQKRPG